ncbi:MAG: hypothetical protein ACI89X_004188 [Planctomycetota bacterium]|jgi:hypothetical protein
MQAHPVPIARLVNIELDNIGTMVHGMLERDECVFGSNTTRTTMRDDLNGTTTQSRERRILK